MQVVKRLGRATGLVGQSCIAAIVDTDGLQDTQVWQGNRLARTGTAKDISTVTTMMFPVGKGEAFAATHAHIGINPFRRGRAVEHAAGNLGLWWEVKTFSLQRLVGLANVYQVGPSLCSSGPRLDQFKYLLLDLVIQGSTSVSLEEGCEIVDELARGNFSHEMGASILDARVGKVQGSKLNVWILVAYSALERAHCLLGLHRLGSDSVGDFQVQSNILQTGRRCQVYLPIKGRVAGTKPSGHGVDVIVVG